MHFITAIGWRSTAHKRQAHLAMFEGGGENNTRLQAKYLRYLLTLVTRCCDQRGILGCRFSLPNRSHRSTCSRGVKRKSERGQNNSTRRRLWRHLAIKIFKHSHKTLKHTTLTSQKTLYFYNFWSKAFAGAFEGLSRKLPFAALSSVTQLFWLTRQASTSMS